MVAFLMAHRLVPKYSCICTPLAQQCRSYALSRIPHRPTGFGRNSRSSNVSRRPPSPEDRLGTSSNYEEKENREGSVRPSTDPGEGLKYLLANNNELVVTRQLEMLNIFMGFEQANRYVITNPAGVSQGYIVEEPRGFLSMFARQVFRTHRPFRALVMDLEGSPILWIRRPFSWINSRMFVESPKDLPAAAEEPLVLDTFAEVQQEWHLWRRRYNLFLRSTPHRVLTTLDSDPLPEVTPEVHFNQFARVDEGLWAWHFVLRDAQGQGMASIDRAFRGFGREILTDTGQYTVSFRAPDEHVHSSSQNGNEWVLHKPSASRHLTVHERALVLAMAINIDYDYFSRHSEGGGFGFYWSSGE